MFTAAYVTEFERMEKQLVNPYEIPKTYADALYLAAAQQKELQHIVFHTCVDGDFSYSKR